MERELAALHDASCAWALACCAFDSVEAEDVVQTAYLEILDGRARFEGRSSLRTFVFGVIRRVASSRRRRRFLRTLLLDRFAHESGRYSADAAEPDVDRPSRIRAALASLPARQREVIDLVFFHDLTLDEAAAVMAVSPGSARTHYHRAKERLGTQLEDLA